MTLRILLRGILTLAALAVIALVAYFADLMRQPAPRRPGTLSEIRAEVIPRLQRELTAKDLALGSPVFIRIFKATKELEVWLSEGPRYRLFKTYPICAYSGTLGPKLREGDGQAPEGFYTVGRSQLNPASNYHLSFNLGYPNAFDRALGRTGSFLMVHGRCASVGCYAMTDPGIEEIYLLVEAAVARGGRSVPVHIFPFRMTGTALMQHRQSEWHGFWSMLKPAYDAFERTRTVPATRVAAGAYIVAP
ncbi:MAG: murein L,D-transpeptidase family protein [Hyphomicrobiaceae bacterium]